MGESMTEASLHSVLALLLATGCGRSQFDFQSGNAPCAMVDSTAIEQPEIDLQLYNLTWALESGDQFPELGPALGEVQVSVGDWYPGSVWILHESDPANPPECGIAPGRISRSAVATIAYGGMELDGVLSFGLPQDDLSTPDWGVAVGPGLLPLPDTPEIKGIVESWILDDWDREAEYRWGEFAIIGVGGSEYSYRGSVSTGPPGTDYSNAGYSFKGPATPL